MDKKKHYNRGQEIALTFPVSKEAKEQAEITKKLKEQLVIQKKQNEKQAKLLKQLEEKLNEGK